MSMSVRVVCAFLAALALAQPLTASAEGVEDGKRVFKKCLACHETKATKNKVGPHLVGIVGRKAAVVAEFKYSDAMRSKAAENLVWNEEALSQYLKNPKTFIPGNKMAFPGLKKDQQIKDLIAYLREEAK